ncbi:hypothetical protein ACFYOT_06825 [Saccharothrix saharensis]|uniref:hypothetical protein n=1 Tax=Saccharothrix saharensis TaxID=571190 RepID=UPI0036C920D5
MTQPVAEQVDDLYVPDRFEGLVEAGTNSLQTIIVPVENALRDLDNRFLDMRVARRGALMVLRGKTGSGKSTFLDTVHLFRKGMVTETILAAEGVADRLGAIKESAAPRIIVLEGREAMRDVLQPELEATLHIINSFLRSSSGRNTLIVWPTNTDDLARMLNDLARTLGGEALVGLDANTYHFTGPDKSQFFPIAKNTIATLNKGASLVALGISDERAQQIAEQASTIGNYMALIRRELIANQRTLQGLLPAERYKMWVVVIAGNEPEGDVAALTRGGYAFADIDRLMTATGANVVQELKKTPDKVGILATVLDARILFVEMRAALAIARTYGNDRLHAMMKSVDMSTRKDGDAAERLRTSELGVLLSGASLGTRKRGGKAGSNTHSGFLKLTQIARSDDGVINESIGAGLLNLGLIESYETEYILGDTVKYFSDIYCVRTDQSPLRLEVMWRATTSRAEIANYVLGKLQNYGKAIGLLE